MVSDYMSGSSATEPAWPYYHGSEAQYCDVHRIGARRARAMADYLGKLDKAMHRASASEAGDRFAVFAKSIGAQCVWMAKGPDHTDIRQCVKYSVAEGRDRYRGLIAEARLIVRGRLLPAA
jgi:hypothetical protein